MCERTFDLAEEVAAVGTEFQRTRVDGTAPVKLS
jgi:hypothetical protein